MTDRTRLWLATCVVGLAGVIGCFVGCSDGGGGNQLPVFQDVTSAPQAIRSAAGAVVRVRTAGSYGTGSFISADGLLLTNNHVLGAAVCPVEGCALQLTFNHERGDPYQPPMNLYAVPVAVDVGLDMAVLQVRTNAGGAPLNVSSHLEWNVQQPAALMGMRVHVVGHPEGRVKKWTSGVVVDAFGDWFTSTAYILPGDSGSPVLDDSGALVGIVHHGPGSQDQTTADGVNVWSTGTASAPLSAAMNATLPPVMISLGAPTTAAAAMANNVVYLNGRASTVLADGASASVLALLGQACDAALARTDFQSIEDLERALVPCNDGLTWIECRADAAPPSYGVVCPQGDEGAAWSRRLQQMNDVWVAMNGNTNLTPVSFGVAALSSSKSAGQAAAAASLLQALTAAQQPIDFSVANYLAAFSVDTYGDVDTRRWLRGYARAPHYELSGTSIASAYLWWSDNGGLDQTEARNALAQLHGNPNVAVGTKLYIEEVDFDRNW